ncbi:MAG: 4Fe-4S binding protein [Thermoplasmata archaeon]|nr:4Fe-4S binding protein [Thermoplasmata archaeon]
MKIDRTICMYCGACAGTCPTLALVLEEIRVRFIPEKCNNCGMCEMVCPVGAIDLDAEGDA